MGETVRDFRATATEDLCDSHGGWMCGYMKGDGRCLGE